MRSLEKWAQQNNEVLHADKGDTLWIGFSEKDEEDLPHFRSSKNPANFYHGKTELQTYFVQYLDPPLLLAQTLLAQCPQTLVMDSCLVCTSRDYNQEHSANSLLAEAVSDCPQH